MFPAAVLPNPDWTAHNQGRRIAASSTELAGSFPSRRVLHRVAIEQSKALTHTHDVYARPGPYGATLRATELDPCAAHPVLQYYTPRSKNVFKVMGEEGIRIILVPAASEVVSLDTSQIAFEMRGHYGDTFTHFLHLP